MSDDIDTRISLGLDPEAVMATIEEYDEDTSSYLSTAKSAFTEAYSALRGIHDAKAAAETDPTLNPAGALLKTDEYARARMAKVYPLWDAASASLNIKVEAWEKELGSAVTSKASQMVSGEVRAFFKTLTTGERMAAMQRAIRDGDETTATAVLGGPAYLSGLDNEMQAILLREWNERSNPKLAKMLRAVTKARDLIDDRLPVLRKELIQAVGVLEERQEVRDGRTVVTKTITPAQLRAMRDSANKPFAITGA